MIALFVSTAAAYVPILLFGDWLGTAGEIIVSTVVSGVAYVVTIYYMKKLRGDF